MREGLSGKSYFLVICTLTSNTKENGLTNPGYEHEGYITFNIGQTEQ